MKAVFTMAMVGFLASPALADVTYECHINSIASNGGWLPEVVVASVSGDGQTATVNDPFIMHFKKSPVNADIVADNDKRLTLAWRLKVKNDRNQYANFAYRLTIMKGALTADMSAQPLPYDNQFRATGGCRKVKA